MNDPFKEAIKRAYEEQTGRSYEAWVKNTLKGWSQLYAGQGVLDMMGGRDGTKSS